MDSEVELQIESFEIKPKERLLVDEDGNPVVWKCEIIDLPAVHSLDPEAPLELGR